MPRKDRREEIVKEYYNNYGEDERFLSQHRKVEFITTTTYIEKYAKKGCKIVELGAGTGAYSLYLAKKGYKVDAVEFSEHNLEVLKAAGEDIANLTIRQGDAVELGIYTDNLFDVTLSLGPMYHIFNEKDIKQAIKEAIRITRPGGIIIFSYLTNDSVFARYMVQKGNIKEYKKLCDGDFNFKPIPEEIFYTTNVKDFENLVNKENVSKVASVAADGLSEILASEIDSFDENEFKAYVAYHLARCEREELHGYSAHMLYICKKDEVEIEEDPEVVEDVPKKKTSNIQKAIEEQEMDMENQEIFEEKKTKRKSIKVVQVEEENENTEEKSED